MQEIEPTREISQQISSLNADVAYLFDELCILEKRLDPIMPPMPPTGDGEETSSEGVDEPFVPRSQVASQLETISTKLVQLRRRVAYLHQYVEI